MSNLHIELIRLYETRKLFERKSLTKNAIAKYLPGKYLANQRKCRLSPNSIFSCGSLSWSVKSMCRNGLAIL